MQNNKDTCNYFEQRKTYHKRKKYILLYSLHKSFVRTVKKTFLMFHSLTYSLKKSKVFP